MNLEWPWTTKRTLRATIAAERAIHDADLAALKERHRLATLTLDEQHALELAQANADKEAMQKRLALGSVTAVQRSILQERARCAEVARRQNTSARPAILRQRILDQIENAAPPKVRHPLLPDEENPTLQVVLGSTSDGPTTATLSSISMPNSAIEPSPT